MEAGQTIKGRAAQKAALLTPHADDGSNTSTVQTTAMSLKIVGMALRQLISSVVKREEDNKTNGSFNSSLSSTGGIIEYDDVRKFVQLIRRSAQQRLMPLRSEMDVSLQRDATTGSEALRTFLNVGSPDESFEKQQQNKEQNETQHEGTVENNKEQPSTEDTNAKKEKVQEMVELEKQKLGNNSRRSSFEDDLKEGQLAERRQSRHSRNLTTALIFAPSAPLDAGRCLWSSQTPVEAALHSSIPSEESAEMMCVELLSMLVSRDGGKNGIANYTALWARKTYSLWESLIAAAQPIRLSAVPTYGSFDENADDENPEKITNGSDERVAYYTPHFPHTIKALRVMRSLLVEIMDSSSSSSSSSSRRDTANTNVDAMSAFVARALRGEQVIPFLVSICRKDAEIAGRGRSAVPQADTKDNADLPDQILNLLSKDSKCGVIVQSRRGILRRSMYPGYDDKQDDNNNASSAISRDMTKMTSIGINPHAATIPPSSTVHSMGGGLNNGASHGFSRPSPNDFRFPSDFHRKYKLGVLIGDGASCEVHECVSRRTTGSSGGTRYAVKRVPKRYFSALASSQRGWQRILDEVEMQQKMSHSAIVEVHEVFEDSEYLYVVLELMQDDLLNRLLDRIQENRHYNEREVRIIFLQLLQAIKYLHSERGITHRDIKPENILLVTSEDDTTIKLADFGAACWSRQRGSARMRSYVGSPQYMAPEVIYCALNPKQNPQGYTPAVDLWSIGVLLYVMLCRRLPFDADAHERASTTDEHEAERRLRNRIMAGTFRPMHDVSPPLSLEAISLIKQLLEVSPTDRLTVDEALASPWMTM